MPGLATLVPAWLAYARGITPIERPVRQFVFPTELSATQAWIWADLLSGTFWYYGDKPAFADAITRLVEDAGLRRRMGDKAAARSRDYSWRRAMETLEGYYYEVLATARSTST